MNAHATLAAMVEQAKLLTQQSEQHRRASTVSLWVVQSVLCERSVGRRAELLGYFVRLAQQLQQLGNLHGACAIVSALQSAPLFRLTKTWAQHLPNNVRVALATLDAKDLGKMAAIADTIMAVAPSSLAAVQLENTFTSSPNHLLELCEAIARLTNTGASKHLTPFQGTPRTITAATPALVGRRERQLLQRLASLFSEEDNFGSQRSRLRSALSRGSPFVPHLGPYLRDLLHMELCAPQVAVIFIYIKKPCLL
ncbi:hypothetical protein HPB50_023288 [Hyalomma asiaticum]|uniref:Uncharacterized protein n=1 Tax=Hyalomma asiaticum TaxID=266040 RepID=A0ACB7TN66_HYAAI|nr:hypothetical protein HPB50_023288 [Hyalomma asiaticum]